MTPIQNIESKQFTQGSVNILFRLQELVCRINAQLSRLSQETQSRSQAMKKDYRVETDKSAKLTKAVGNFAPLFSGLALGTAVAANFFLDKDLAKKYEVAIGVAPKCVESTGQCVSSYYNADIAQANSVSSLRQNEIQNESGKSGEARDLQSELQQLLANIRDLFKKASS